MKVKVLSINVRLWTRDRDKNDSFYWKDRMKNVEMCILDNDPDVLFVQELMPPATRYIPKQYKKVGLSLHHSIYVKKGWKKRKHIFRRYYEVADMVYNGEPVRLINVHLSLDRKKRERDIAAIERYRSEKENYIIGGDFNVGWRDLLDINTAFFYGASTTFVNHLSLGNGSLDHFFTSEPGAFSVLGKLMDNGASYEGSPISDHTPIIIKI